MLANRVRLIVIGLFVLLPLFSQNALVVLQNQINTDQQVVNIKWYSQEFIYPEGVNIYRCDSGTDSWVKLNSFPIKQNLDIPQIELDKDSDLLMFREVMKEIKPEQIEGFILLHLMAKSFGYPIFSKSVGIQFDDTQVVLGNKYKYKIMRIIGTGEKLLALSDIITVGVFTPLDAPKGFFARQHRISSTMGWEPEDSRFYAINVYRSDLSGKEIKLNKHPVTISMVKDSTGKLGYPEIKFSDDSVHEGGIYYYRIAGMDFFGNETKYSEPIKVIISDLTNPSAPINIKRTIRKLDVHLSWENTEFKELAGFNIYRSVNDSNDYYAVNPGLLLPGITSFQDRVPASGGYYYRIAAVDTVGNESYSDKLFVDVADLAPPAIPQNIKAVADTGCVRLTWDAVSDRDLMGYQVYRTINSNNKEYYVLINAIALKKNCFTDSLPANARNYFYYKVISIDTSYNRSDYSESVSAKMPDVVAPEKPFIRNVSQLNNNLIIEWFPNMEPDLIGYEVYRSTKDTTANYEKINDGILNREVARFTDRNALPQISYNYFLVAIDSTGNRSAASNYFTSVLTLDKRDMEASVVHSFVVKKRKKIYKMKWEIAVTTDFIGVAIFRKNSSDELPVKITDIIRTEFYSDTYKGNSAPLYQLRLYHKSGIVVKTDWVKI